MRRAHLTRYLECYNYFMDYRDFVSSPQITAFCQKYHIRRFSFFGSVIRSDFGPHSDVDVLIEFEEGHTPGLGFFSMETELARLFGKKVDLLTPGFLGKEIRETVLSEAVSVYEQA